MSAQHTQGRLIVDGALLRAENNNVVVDASRRLVNWEADLRHMAACWNLCDGITTNDVEIMGKGGGLTAVLAVRASAAVDDDAEIRGLKEQLAEARARIAELDAQLGKRPCQNERCADLAAARALLQEVYEEGNLDVGDQVSKELDNRIAAFLKGQP